MREIENELRLWHYRYAWFIRLSERRKAILEKAKPEEVERFQRLDEAFRGFPHFGYSRSRTMISAAFVLGWAAVVICEIVLTFFK